MPSSEDSPGILNDQILIYNELLHCYSNAEKEKVSDKVIFVPILSMDKATMNLVKVTSLLRSLWIISMLFQRKTSISVALSTFCRKKIFSSSN